MNKFYYENSRIVKIYKNHNYLLKPEQKLISLLGDSLSEMKMLDIGVGAGRTTRHFLPIVREYVGIDYSPSMIEACHSTFNPHEGNPTFMVCDARSMDILDDNQFDLVIFSFNGIDCVDHAGRLDILKEVRRVGKDEGTFFFSTHNIYAIEKALTWNDLKNPLNMPWTLYSMYYIRRHNDFGDLVKNEHAVFKEITNGFETIHYYVRPEFQINQLEDMGFKDISVFSTDGNVVDVRVKGRIYDKWPHFLCKIDKKG